MVISKRPKQAENNKCWQGGGEIRNLVHCCGNVKWYKHYEKQYGDSSKN